MNGNVRVERINNLSGARLQKLTISYVLDLALIVHDNLDRRAGRVRPDFALVAALFVDVKCASFSAVHSKVNVRIRARRRLGVQTNHLVLIIAVANRRDAAHSVGGALHGALAHGTRVPAAPTLRALDHAR